MVMQKLGKIFILLSLVWSVFWVFLVVYKLILGTYWYTDDVVFLSTHGVFPAVVCLGIGKILKE